MKKNLKLLIILLISSLALSGCKLYEQSKSSVIPALKSIGKEKLKQVLELDNLTLQKDTIDISGKYETEKLVKKLGKNFAIELTAKGSIGAETLNFKLSFGWFPVFDTDSTKEYTNVHFYYLKLKK